VLLLSANEESPFHHWHWFSWTSIAYSLQRNLFRLIKKSFTYDNMKTQSLHLDQEKGPRIIYCLEVKSEVKIMPRLRKICHRRARYHKQNVQELNTRTTSIVIGVIRQQTRKVGKSCMPVRDASLLPRLKKSAADDAFLKSSRKFCHVTYTWKGRHRLLLALNEDTV
jgi:hypothetical protein